MAEFFICYFRAILEIAEGVEQDENYQDDEDNDDYVDQVDDQEPEREHYIEYYPASEESEDEFEIDENTLERISALKMENEERFASSIKIYLFQK